MVAQSTRLFAHLKFVHFADSSDNFVVAVLNYKLSSLLKVWRSIRNKTKFSRNRDGMKFSDEQWILILIERKVLQ